MTEKLKFVEVNWMDAHSVATWVDVDEPLPSPVACVSRGWLVKETKEYLVLAGTLSLTSSGKVYGFGEVIAIPKKGFVVKMKRMKV